MQPRESRYWLRFESGERRGEKVPLPEGDATLGRKPGNQLVIDDGSVSGKHARISIDNGQVFLADLGSTNGTRVGQRRIEKERLAHGDQVQLGTVKLVFLDEAVGGVETLESSPPELEGDEAAPADELGHIAAEQVASSGRRSLLGPILLVVAFGGAAFLAWQRFGGHGTQVETVAVPEVPGNLCADGSFEDVENPAAWESADAASQAFYRDAAHAKSGRLGLGTSLGAGEWAFASSETLRLPARRSLSVRGSIWAEDGAEARLLGIELASTTDQGPAFIAWAPSVRVTDGFEDIELELDLPAGYDSGRVVVAARAGAEGAVSLDDVSVVVGEPLGDHARLLEFEGYALGANGSTAVLTRSGRVLFVGIGLGSWGSTGLSGWSRASWRVSAKEKGMHFVAAGASDDATLHLCAVGETTGSADDPREALISTIGPDGYRSHSGEFDVEQASSLLLGRGIDLIRLSFERPVRISGSVSDGTLRVRARMNGLDAFDLQLTFTEERAQAATLAERAQEAERGDEYGAALAAWSTLLDRYPFEARLVELAEAARGRLVQRGLETVDDVRREVERAAFFELADLYRQCRERATAVVEGYRDTEVALEANKLVAQIDLALEQFGSDASQQNRERVERILEALDAGDSPRLVEHLRAYVK